MNANASTTSHRLAMAWIAVCACALVSCESALHALTRRHTYPPAFSYITDEQLETTMWQLAAQMTALDRILAGGETPSPSQRLQVISILARMLEMSGELGPEHWPSNHPKVSRNIGRFRKDLTAAKRAVEVDPPSYYRAGTISGACMHCHGDD